MSTPFSENLRLVLKMLSMSPAGLASQLGTNKSVISRWLAGSARPTAHNLSRLSALVARRVDGFTALDWERDPRSMAERFGVDPVAIPAVRAAGQGMILPVWDQAVAAVAARGQVYEGFFRSTRPHSNMPGRFLHDYGMIRRDAAGHLRVAMGSLGSVVEGWVMPLHGSLYFIVANARSGMMMFGVFNDPPVERLDAFEGLVLIPGLDAARTPTATAMICERIGMLSDEPEADDRRFAELSSRDHLAREGSIPEDVVKHLVRDFGPRQLTEGGDWLLNSPLIRSMARGFDFRKRQDSRDAVDSDAV
jgi:transcriptional regulator with XRE-family HTH domain